MEKQYKTKQNMTTVEWLAEEFEESYSYINEIFKETIEQAKEMEKQQIINALHYFGIEMAEQYYSQTFKNEK
jgi:hypothetical protein